MQSLAEVLLHQCVDMMNVGGWSKQHGWCLNKCNVLVILYISNYGVFKQLVCVMYK